MHFGKSPQHKAPRWEHSFQRSMAIANITTFPQRSAFSCSTTIAPEQTRADRPKAPTKKATRCGPGGLSPNASSARRWVCVQRSARGNEWALYLLVNCRPAGAAISFPPCREFRHQRGRAANRRLSEDTSRSTGAIPACALKAHFGMRLRKLRTFEALRAQKSFR